MKKHEAGNGSYGYSYENKIRVGDKEEWHKYTFWYKSPESRDIAMNLIKQSLPGARKLKRVGR